MGLFGNRERKNIRRYEEAYEQYQKGEITKAIKLVMGPAADCYAPAQNLMGLLSIEKGMYDDADYWFNAAIKGGYAQAQKNLDYLHNEVLKNAEKQEKTAQTAPHPAPETSVAPPQKSKEQLHAETEAEQRHTALTALRSVTEAVLTAKLEAEKQQKAAILEAELQKAAMLENADRMMIEARNFCARGDIDTAEKILTEILAQLSDHRSAQFLMQDIQDARAYEKEKAEKEAAEREQAEKERLKAELRARTEAKVRAEMEAEAKARAEAEEKARLEAEAKARAEAEKQSAVAEDNDEIFTQERLAIMEAVAAEGRQKQLALKEEWRDHWAEELDNAEELYRKGDYEHAFMQAYMYMEASARAINMMGAMYLTGRGTEKDLVKARDFFDQAQRLGYVPAMYNQAMMMLMVDGDEEEALIQIKNLADKGHLPSMVQAGKMYLDGIGTSESELNGWFWLCAAARNGHMPTARRILKVFHEQPEKAPRLRRYLDILCKAGDTDLTINLARVFVKGVPGKMKPDMNSVRFYRNILKEKGYRLDDIL